SIRTGTGPRAGAGGPDGEEAGADAEVPDSDLTEPRPASAQQSPSVSPTAHRRHRDTPRVRRLASEHGVDLASVPRSGRHGRATPADVVAAAQRQVEREAPRPPATRPEPARPTSPPAPSPSAPSPPAPSPRQPSPRGRVERLSRRRRVIAERMHRSLQESAQLTTVIEVDLTRVVATREAVKETFRARFGVPLSALAFVAEAAVQALAEHPVVHAELDLEGGTITYPSTVDLGIAVDTEEGLVVPVIRSADDLTVGALARHIADRAARARDGSATADDYAGGSFTITNTGSRGALFDTPILNAPQSAILGFGAVVRRPVVLRGEDGEDLIAVRSMAYLALTYDHRLVDGADAARYLAAVKDRLEAPDRPWLDAVGIKETAS
ncbi:MAG TPA: 2-oxo acid dehydrogenase subunit E2, partial [Intrasporangium sp.]|uniref:2-oxo acid dehydrogenase subunit E2 n=1 Tax=Intrasporangium sp. TaxID=1925024 RepID=UPI002D76A1E6